jgi:hypothetical protein
MPVMGPTYSETYADQLFEKVKKLLTEEEKQLNFPPDPFWKDKREEVWNNLKIAIHHVVRQDSWESW